jgi:hypothetical protein
MGVVDTFWAVPNMTLCPGRGSASGCPRQGPRRLGGGAGRGQPVRPRGASGRGPGGLRKGRAGRS